MIGDFFYKEKMNDLTRSRCEYLLRNNRLVNDWNTVVEQLLLQNQPKTVKKKRKKKNTQEKVKSQHILLLEQKLNGVYYKYLSSGSENLGSFSRVTIFSDPKMVPYARVSINRAYGKKFDKNI